MGNCHHLTKFGFVAFPDSLSANKYVFIINENNTIFRTVATTAVGSRSTNPPGLAGIQPEYLNWPSDEAMKARWAKLD